MDTAQVIANYLRNNPASACLVNTPLGYLSLILEMYERELEGLPVFCDANILQSIVQETKSDVVQDVMIGTSLYGRYACLIAMDANKDSESHQRAVKMIFKESFSICLRAWKTILHYWKYVGEAEKEDWRKAIEFVVRGLVLLVPEEGGEILYLDNLACLSMPFPLALHCWLFSPDSDTRNQLDDACETAESYDGSGVGFYDSGYEPYLASIGSDQILEKSLHIMKCAQDCIRSRHRAMGLVLTLSRDVVVQLPSGCEAELLDIVWQTLQTESASSKSIINDTGNGFLDIILNQSENPIKILHKIFSLHNGARVFICNAGVQASFIGASKIFLFSQVTKHITTNSDKQAVAELKSVVMHQLSPVMPPLLSRLRNLGTSVEKRSAETVINELVSLGRIVGL